MDVGITIEIHPRANSRSEYLCMHDIPASVKPMIRVGDDMTNKPQSPTPVTGKGLCINCDDRHLCRYPSFGANVIHCEGYI